MSGSMRRWMRWKLKGLAIVFLVAVVWASPMNRLADGKTASIDFESGGRSMLAAVP
jgi:hypothetical protein